ncbi:hypothetical protein ACHAXN_007641 [Cyclotella atomus]
MNGSSLPLPPSLAAALSQHGIRSSSASASSKQHSPSASSAAAPKRTTIQALTMHPSLPRVAYLAEETTSLPPPSSSSPLPSKKNKVETAPAITRTSIKTQRILIQSFDKNCTSPSSSQLLLKQQDIQATLPMEHLSRELNRFRSGKVAKTKSNTTPLTLANIGPLQSIQFLDHDALYWTTARKSGTIRNSTCSSIINADTHFDRVDAGLGDDFALGLQFSNLLTIVRLNPHYFSSSTEHNAFKVLCCLEGQPSHNNNSNSQTTEGNTGSSSMYTPTSSCLPLTQSIIVYGCSDGAMRFHNLVPSSLYSSRISSSINTMAGSTSLFSSGSSKLLKNSRQATVKSVRGPNGRNDPIVKIVNVDPSYATHAGGDNSGGESAAEENESWINYRLLTACASGVAYLWDVHIRIDDASGSVKDLIVDPPLVRMDGLGRLTVSPRKSSSADRKEGRSESFWGNATSSKEEGAPPYMKVVPAIYFDHDRELLVWALPREAPAASVDHRGDFKLELAEPDSIEAKREDEDKAYLTKWSGNGDNGGFVKVWNMSLVNGLVSKTKKKKETEASTSPQPPPKFAPAAVYKLHPSSASSISPSCVFGGLQIGPLTPNELSYTCLSRDGSELIVQAAPLPMTASNTNDSWLVQSSISTAPKKQKNGFDRVKIFYASFQTRHTMPISSLGRGIASLPRVKGLSFAASYSSHDILAIASDDGVMIGSIAKGGSWYTEVEKYPLAESNSLSLSLDTQTGHVHTIISGGPVSSLNNRPGVLFVENNAVYASRLTTSAIPSDHKESTVEKIGLQDPMLMHVLQDQAIPWYELRSTRISIFAEVREQGSSQPRLIPSPSGRYLCLLWENEMRYEILHARSLLTKDANAAAGVSSRIDPSVDSGSQILSFAWVGDDDRFAILPYVDLHASKAAVQSSPARGGESNISRPSFTRRKVFSRLISPNGDGSESDYTESSIKPYVELKKLAEAQIDAVELAAGAGVAAATTVDLGRLPVRGGDRSIPTVLFGGPALCLGTISISNRSGETSIDNSMSYFYMRKSGAVKAQDEKATSYMTVGPELPYPSLVAWDEEGKLCAMAIGSRVAIYLSQPPNFTLLGGVTISTGSKAGTDGSLISLKFIHGVLYCSTQSSVHVIFLGNLEDNDIVCEMDVFTLATNKVPFTRTENPDGVCPQPAVTSLMQPHVLAYHCGGLLVSTSSGLRLLPMSHPTLRIGTLLGANLVEKARKWIYAIPSSDHDVMAQFLIRRGRPDLAISDLDGLSVERYIDLCMLYDRADELEYLVVKEGPALVSQISNWKRGSLQGSYSVIFCLGIYFLGKSKLATAKKWTDYALNSGINEVISDAMKLALYISAADRAEGQELIRKASDAMKLDSSGQLAVLGTTS